MYPTRITSYLNPACINTFFLKKNLTRDNPDKIRPESDAKVFFSNPAGPECKSQPAALHTSGKLFQPGLTQTKIRDDK